MSSAASSSNRDDDTSRSEPTTSNHDIHSALKPGDEIRDGGYATQSGAPDAGSSENQNFMTTEVSSDVVRGQVVGEVQHDLQDMAHVNKQGAVQSSEAIGEESSQLARKDVVGDMDSLSRDENQPAQSTSAANALQKTGGEAPPTPLQNQQEHLAQPLQKSRPISRKISRTGSPNQEPAWNEKDPYESGSKSSQQQAEAEFDEKKHSEGETQESKEEIDSIMAQFTRDKSSKTDVKSPPRDFPVFQYPPRSSSLEHLSHQDSSSVEKPSDDAVPTSPIANPRDPERNSVSYAGSIRSQPPPPEPDPEPDLPFDFHRFLEQLRHRTADPVAKFLRSFLLEFGKKQWQVHEQMKIIGDFLVFISNRMAQCDVWRSVSDAEFDNAREGMEKLVMNRLYTQTFSPEIPASEPSPVKGRRKGAAPLPGTGRRGQHQEDVERDEVLAQKVRIYGWIKEEHLDIKPFGEKGQKFLLLAQQELSKIKSYRAPRDKVICVLNCCKVIFGYLRNAQTDQSADSFIPLLIYTVLKAKPDHLVSNVQYILRFRNQEKLGGEAGYYMSSLMGAVQFIETLDRTNLTITPTEFDSNVEAAVSEIAARNDIAEQRRHAPPITLDKAPPSRPEVTPRHSTDGERATRNPPSTSAESSDNEKAAVAGLLRTIQRPLSGIGRIFSEESTPTVPSTPSPPLQPQRQGQTQAATSLPPGAAAAEGRNRMRAEEAAARVASVEAEEAHRAERAEHRTVVETLSGMFPDLDQDVISDVVRMQDGRIGLAVDACLLLSR